MKTIVIDGVEYEPKRRSQTSGYSIIRCDRSGVFCAKVTKRCGQEAVLEDSRRLWYWSGASSLSEMAVKGVSRPKDCKFPISVPEQTVTDVIEIIPMTREAKATIDEVRIWSQH